MILKKLFKKFFSIERYFTEGSAWIIESIDSQYINISTFRSLSGRSYIKLTAELRNSKKGLINIKNNNQKYFPWCHIKHINLVKIHPERIRQKDKEIINDLDYEGIEFPVSKKDFSKIEVENKISISVFCYENKLTYSIYVSEQKFQNSIDFLLISNKNK